jgi:hypothetical protein
MKTADLQPWPHGDLRREADLRGLIRVGVAEAVRTGAGFHYRLLPLSADALARGSEWPAVDRELTIE